MLPPPPEKPFGRPRKGKRTVAGTVPEYAPQPDPEPLEIPDVVPEVPREKPDPAKLSGLEADELRGVLAEIASRQMEALRLFEPTDEQERFFASNADERLAIGGNRGGKAQPIDEPVLTPDGWKPIGSLVVGDVIIGGDGKPCLVTGVFPQGVKPVFRVTFDDGAWTRCCDEHMWKVQLRPERFGSSRGADSWRVLSLGEIRRSVGDTPTPTAAPAIPTCVPWMPSRATPIDPYVLGLLLGDGSTRGGALKITTADDEIREAISRALGPSYELRLASRCDYRVVHVDGPSNPLIDACRFMGIWDKLAHEKRIPRDYLFNTADVRLAVLRGLMDTDGFISDPAPKNSRQGQQVSFTTTSPGLAEDVAFLVRSLGGKCRASSRVTSYTTKAGERRDGRPSITLRVSLRVLCPFRLTRKAARWVDRGGVTRNRILRSVEPAGDAECVCISVSSPDRTYVTRGLIVTHNTTTTMIELARAVTGQDPHDKYPKADGIFILVAIDLAKCAKVYYRKLFKPGAFYIVKDPGTGQWRTFRPDEDQELEDQKVKAPPLIPRRFVQSISWENKKDEVPKTIRLKNGWELWFFSSGGEWPQGVDVDGVAFDEEIERDGWYHEMSARLADRRKKNHVTGKVKSGKFFWSATPQNGTVQLFDLYGRATEEAEARQAAIERGEDPGPATIESFHFGLDSNPYIATHAKNSMKLKWANNAEEYAVRIEGKFALLGSRVYSEFMPKGVHGIRSFPIPEDWTVYCAVDPGRQVCAVLFCAIAPPSDPEFGGRKIIFDELYIKNCNAHLFAQAMMTKIGHRPVEMGIIDHTAGRQHEIGSGLTNEQQYSAALKAVGFSFIRHGHGFSWGSNDVKGGIEAVHNALHITDGRSELAVMWEKVPNLIWEMERYSYRKLPSGVITDEPIKLRDHLCDCLRYVVAAKLKYVKPGRVKKQGNYVTDYLEQKRRKHAHKKRTESGHGGAVKMW